MLFKEFFNEEEGYALFMQLLNHQENGQTVFVFCDWLEENGFPETSKWIRKVVDRQAPSGTYNQAKLELNNHHMYINYSKSYGYILSDKGNDIRLSNGTFQVYIDNVFAKEKWAEINKELAKKIIPGLAALLFINYSNNSESYHRNIIGGLYKTVLDRWIYINSRLPENENEAINFDDYLNQDIEENLMFLVNDTREFLNYIGNNNLSNLRSYITEVLNRIRLIDQNGNLINSIESLLNYTPVNS